jgi:hypothetical protein
MSFSRCLLSHAQISRLVCVTVITSSCNVIFPLLTVTRTKLTVALYLFTAYHYLAGEMTGDALIRTCNFVNSHGGSGSYMQLPTDIKHDAVSVRLITDKFAISLLTHLRFLRLLYLPPSLRFICLQIYLSFAVLCFLFAAKSAICVTVL